MSRSRKNSAMGRYWSKVSDFLQWWKTGLLQCVPQGVRRRLFVAENRWVLVLAQHGGAKLQKLSDSEDILEVFTVSSPEEVAKLRGLTSDKISQIEIAMPSDWVLDTRINLPIAAATNINQVLNYELDRFTPFSAKDVYYDYQVSAESSDKEYLGLRLAILQKRLVDSWLDALLGEKVRPVLLRADNVWEGLNFIKGIDRIAQMPRGQRSYGQVLASIVVAGLLMAVFISPIIQKRTAAIRITQEVDRTKRKADSVLAIRQKIEENETALNFVRDQRQEKTPVVNVLNNVTRLLPDDTWVQQLGLKQDIIELRGESTQATRLIKLFEESPSFTEAAFRSPVVQAGNKERYHVKTRLLISGAVE